MRNIERLAARGHANIGQAGMQARRRDVVLRLRIRVRDERLQAVREPLLELDLERVVP